MLDNIVFEIVKSRPAGMKHFEIVKEVLRKGYRHVGDEPISEAVYEALKKLVVCGEIRRIQNERLERMYKTIKVANNKFEDYLEDCFEKSSKLRA